MINILYTGNSKVFDGVLTSVLSILKRETINREFNVYLFTMDVTRINSDYTPISESQAAFLEKVLKDYNSSSRVTLIDVTETYEKEFGYSPNEGAYCSPYTLIRLFADEVENIPDKLLYLDVDLMFMKDITLLYDTDVTGYEYAAARDHYGKFLIQPNYINAGVILFNMVEVKRTGLLKKARQLIKTKKLVFADQSAIMRSTTKKKMLPQKFNDQKFLTKKTVVRHFSKRLFWLPYPHTENIKQWQVEKVRKKFGYPMLNDIYEEYFRYKNEFEGKNI